MSALSLWMLWWRIAAQSVAQPYAKTKEGEQHAKKE